MQSEFGALEIKQLDDVLARWRSTAQSKVPRTGWLRTIRQALGMSTAQVAFRLGASQPRVVKLEKAEIDGSVTIASMHKAARAIGCEFVYAVVPHESLEAMLRRQADLIARREMESTRHTMRLEKQQVDPRTETRQLNALRKRLLAGSRRRLWK